MDLRDLYYFEVIAAEEHLGRAAEKVFRTQPALSKSLKRLEDELGAALFERSGRKLKLTPLGHILVSRAKFLRRTMEDTSREMSDFAQGVIGHVRLGSAATAAEYLLPQVASELMRDTPGLTMELVIGMNDVLRESLRIGLLDLVVGPLTKVESEFTTHAIIKDEVVVAASRTHPLFLADTIQLSDLCDYGWVLPARTVAMRAWLDRVFERRKLPPPRAQFESNSISLMPRLIASTNLLSFISRRNLGPGKAGEALREIALPETTMKRNFGIVWRSTGYLSPAAITVVNLIKSRGKDLFFTS